MHLFLSPLGLPKNQRGPENWKGMSSSVFTPNKIALTSFSQGLEQLLVSAFIFNTFFNIQVESLFFFGFL